MSTFLSRCLSSRVRASVSPPGHTAEDSPSVSKPEEQILIQNLIYNRHMHKEREHRCLTELF